MSETKEWGDRGEAQTARFLRGRGCRLLASQWRCRFGELDLVARDPSGTILFVEVKLRGEGSIALPREFVDGRKQARIRAAAALWLSRYAPDAPARFDVAEIYASESGELRVEYLEDAFQ